jgi:hypothetical protein
MASRARGGRGKICTALYWESKPGRPAPQPDTGLTYVLCVLRTRVSTDVDGITEGRTSVSKALSDALICLCACNNYTPIGVCDTVLCTRLLSNPG